MAKKYVVVKGRLQRMDEAAFKIAQRHFGATESRPEKKEVPIELLNLPKKEDIIRKQEPKTDVPVIEPKKEKAIEKVEKLPVQEPELEKVEVKKTVKRKAKK